MASSNDPMHLSIIIPFHNRMPLLNDLLASLPDADGIEVICVDDKSTDAVSIERKFEKSHLRILSTPEGKRFAGAARNVGLNVARGMFICFCDSDDIVDPDVLMGAVSHAAETEVDVVYSYSTSFSNDGSESVRADRLNSYLRTVEAGWDRNLLVRMQTPWAKVYRRDFIELHGLRFDPIRYSEDAIFNARMWVADPTTSIFNGTFYKVREHEDSLMANPSVDVALEKMQALRKYNSILSKNGLSQYRVPAYSHLRVIYPRHRVTVFVEMTKSAALGQPLFSPWYVRKQGLKRRAAKIAGVFGRKSA